MRTGRGVRRGALFVVAATLLVGCGAAPSPPASPADAPTAGPSPLVQPAPPHEPAPGEDRPPSAPPAQVVLAGASAPAPVVLAPVAADGSLAVPDDVSELGWWVGSAPMGAAAGTTLVAGHVDSAEQGLGVFAALRTLEVGDPVTVVDGLGQPYGFRVTGVEEYVKSDLPEELFSDRGPRRLALVTCSGPFDPEARHYRDNLVVWAAPA